MSTVWGIHNDVIPASELVAEGFISVGWDEIGDLREIGDDQAALKVAVAAANPDAKPGAIPGWAGALRRFAFDLAEGDLVVAPSKQEFVYNIGRVVGPYEFHADLARHRHRRPVEWLVTDVSREDFTQGARYELGAAGTFFRVANHAEEFEYVVEGGVPEAQVAASEPDRVRQGLLQRAVLEILSESAPIPRRDVIKEVARRVDLTDYELEKTAKGISRYEVAVSWGSVDMVAAGWIQKTSRGWLLTNRGRRTLADPRGRRISPRSRMRSIASPEPRSALAWAGSRLIGIRSSMPR